MIKGIPCLLVHSFISLNATMPWYPSEMDTRAFITQYPEGVHDTANGRVPSIFAFNCLQARHWIRVDYYIVWYCLHVPIIDQCQSDGCTSSSKDGAVIWEFFGQLAASCLTLWEMVVDDHCCPNSLIYIGSVCVGFTMWPLILFESNLCFLSNDHTFAHSNNEAVSRWVKIHVYLVGSWFSFKGKSNQYSSLQRPQLPLPWDQQDMLEVGSCLLSHLAWEHINPQWFDQIRAEHDVLDCQCRH